VDVVLVRWPKENEHRDRLAREGHPRLLLLEAGVLPPLVEDPLEDWVRIPARHRRAARLDTLALRAWLQAPPQPTIDDDGVIRHNGLWASLPPVEARITRLLLDCLGAVVSRESSRAGWPDGRPAATPSMSTCSASAAGWPWWAWPSAPSGRGYSVGADDAGTGPGA
jgi:hypothetical protein